MAKVERSIDVDVPVRTAYNQWTQFEEFPRFMEGVEEVRQIDDRHLHWRAEIAGQIKEWDAEISEQAPDERAVGHRRVAHPDRRNRRGGSRAGSGLGLERPGPRDAAPVGHGESHPPRQKQRVGGRIHDHASVLALHVKAGDLGGRELEAAHRTAARRPLAAWAARCDVVDLTPGRRAGEGGAGPGRGNPGLRRLRPGLY